MRSRKAPLKVCEHCGDAFTPKRPYAPRPARFCSFGCYQASRERKPKPELKVKRIADDEPTITLPNGKRTRAVNQKCQRCHSEFLAIPARVKAGQARFCSRSCARKHDHEARAASGSS